MWDERKKTEKKNVSDTDTAGDLAVSHIKQSENFRHQQFGLSPVFCMWVLQTQACTTDVTNHPQTCLRDNSHAVPSFLHILWI